MNPSSASPRVLNGSILFLLAGLAAMGSLATNVILPVFPGMSVSLGVEPRDLGLTGLQLSLYFAATVFIVFGAGFLAPRLARRWGQAWAVMIGAVIALTGSLAILILAASPSLLSITAGLGLFLLGMGFLNPLGTAITLQPFSHNAGLASALLGFLQMACAAIGATAASVLPFPPTTALAATMSVGSALALLVFIPVIVRLTHTKVATAVAANIKN